MLVLLLVLGLVVLLKAALQLVDLVSSAEHALEDVGRLLLLVSVEVLLQVATTSEALFAEVAFVRSFARVYSDVSLHVAHLAELLATPRFRTDILLQSCVRPKMQLEPSRVSKCFITHLAFKQPIGVMGSLVLPQFPLGSEHHLARVRRTLIYHLYFFLI